MTSWHAQPPRHTSSPRLLELLVRHLRRPHVLAQAAHLSQAPDMWLGTSSSRFRHSNMVVHTACAGQVGGAEQLPTSPTSSRPCEPSARSCAAHQAVGPQLAARHAQHRARRPVRPAHGEKLRNFKLRLPITLAQRRQLLPQPAVRMALQEPVLALLCGSCTAHIQRC